MSWSPDSSVSDKAATVCGNLEAYVSRIGLIAAASDASGFAAAVAWRTRSRPTPDCPTTDGW
ncbi:hypothetical protein OG984_12475 [Nocardioides sp. NBC_00368]|uniref:hypothetical protein n=1 Tax=Nocardioides sp. NBC_00368 TaxID=2976000 RepID=UPI002E2302CE